MKRSTRSAGVCFLTVGVMVSGFAAAAPAGAAIIISEPFNGTGAELPPGWNDVDADWRRVDGAAKISIMSVAPGTNIGYSIRKMSSTFAKRGLVVSTKLRLSPTHSNVGVVGPYMDVGNHLFCKVEKTPAHPNGFMAIGRRLRDMKPAILVKRDQLGLAGARRYTLKLTRRQSAITCSISRAGTVLGTLQYTLRSGDRTAYGAGRKVGIRMRLVSRGTRRDEDDGRSSFESFTAKTIT